MGKSGPEKWVLYNMESTMYIDTNMQIQKWLGSFH